MSDDLISRQAAIEHLKKRLYETELNSIAKYPYYAEMADNRLDVWMNELPTVDAVPVVRCKYCKNWDMDTYYLSKDEAHCYCIMVDHRTTPDFFCGDGKRKERLP